MPSIFGTLPALAPHRPAKISSVCEPESRMVWQVLPLLMALFYLGLADAPFEPWSKHRDGGQRCAIDEIVLTAHPIELGCWICLTWQVFFVWPNGLAAWVGVVSWLSSNRVGMADMPSLVKVNYTIEFSQLKSSAFDPALFIFGILFNFCFIFI